MITNLVATAIICIATNSYWRGGALVDTSNLQSPQLGSRVFIEDQISTNIVLEVNFHSQKRKTVIQEEPFKYVFIEKVFTHQISSNIWKTVSVKELSVKEYKLKILQSRKQAVRNLAESEKQQKKELAREKANQLRITELQLGSKIL